MYVTAKSQIEALDTTVQSYFNLESLLYVQILANVSNSMLIFCCWIKVLKYLSINHSMFQLQATLKLVSTTSVQTRVTFCPRVDAFPDHGVETRSPL